MDKVTLPESELPILAGFWRRGFAFLLDAMLLGLVGWAAGLVAFDALVDLGNWGRAIGFAVALLYFGVTDSTLCAGRSFGKWLLNIKVVGASGKALTVGKSAVRTAVFSIPYFLNGANMDTGSHLTWFGYLDVMIVFGGGLSIVYLFLFNKRTRQSLHDLAVGSYVVSAATDAPVQVPLPLWRIHLGVVGLIVAVSIALPFSIQMAVKSQPFADLLSVQQGLVRIANVRQAGVTEEVNKFLSGKNGATTTHVLSARIVLSRAVADRDGLANECAKVMLDRYPAAGADDAITVVIMYGYDIGIASAWENSNYSYTPAQWRHRMASSSEKPAS